MFIRTSVFLFITLRHPHQRVREGDRVGDRKRDRDGDTEGDTEETQKETKTKTQAEKQAETQTETQTDTRREMQRETERETDSKDTVRFVDDPQQMSRCVSTMLCKFLSVFFLSGCISFLVGRMISKPSSIMFSLCRLLSFLEVSQIRDVKQYLARFLLCPLLRCSAKSFSAAASPYCSLSLPSLPHVLSLSMSLYFCLSLYVSLCRFFSRFLCLSLSVFVYVCVSLCLYRSILWLCLCLCMSVYMSLSVVLFIENSSARQQKRPWKRMGFKDHRKPRIRVSREE